MFESGNEKQVREFIHDNIIRNVSSSLETVFSSSPVQSIRKLIGF
jgi:hypothetical protein